ncbi:M50 family metallopeptidase [Sulfobacillus sp. hq2]|uniref:M50 family metallopeptidase n=1 Tax=Sulfobacillus sp. hq2 TaxID=2039167 RepID=UPI000CD17E65|nr:M50 family metallopeptidase [Sulfobacillus sp. hq2]POB12207.1 hypothetical protein CO251_00845 [Sulfobacillus sp. hq2]
MIARLIGVALGMVLVHELAHAGVTWALGGRVEGVVWRAWGAVGVRLRVDGLTPSQVALTVAAGPAAEALWLLGVWAVWPTQALWWLMLGVGQWALNLVPWPGVPNDGRQLWRWARMTARLGKEGMSR